MFNYFFENFCVRAEWMIPLETVSKKLIGQTLFHQIEIEKGHVILNAVLQ